MNVNPYSAPNAREASAALQPKRIPKSTADVAKITGQGCMRIITAILGAAALIGGLILPISALIAKDDIVQGLCVGAALIAAAIAYFVAAAKCYRGHWAFIIGVGLIVLGCLGLGSEIDAALANRTENAWLGVVLILLFSICGVLLLWSGHKLHHCSVALEKTKHDS